MRTCIPYVVSCTITSPSLILTNHDLLPCRFFCLDPATSFFSSFFSFSVFNGIKKKKGTAVLSRRGNGPYRSQTRSERKQLPSPQCCLITFPFWVKQRKKEKWRKHTQCDDEPAVVMQTHILSGDPAITNKTSRRKETGIWKSPFVFRLSR